MLGDCGFASVVKSQFSPHGLQGAWLQIDFNDLFCNLFPTHEAN